jgi:hypothetical protein
MPEDTVDGALPPMLGLRKATHEGLKTCVLTGEFAGFAEATCWLFNVRINRPGVDGYGQRPVFVDTRERHAWYVGLFQQCHDEIIRACEEGRLRAYNWKTGEELSKLALRIYREDARLFCADVKNLWSTETSRPKPSEGISAPGGEHDEPENAVLGLSGRTVQPDTARRRRAAKKRRPRRKKVRS